MARIGDYQPPQNLDELRRQQLEQAQQEAIERNEQMQVVHQETRPYETDVIDTPPVREDDSGVIPNDPGTALTLDTAMALGDIDTTRTWMSEAQAIANMPVPDGGPIVSEEGAVRLPGMVEEFLAKESPFRDNAAALHDIRAGFAANPEALTKLEAMIVRYRELTARIDTMPPANARMSKAWGERQRLVDEMITLQKTMAEAGSRTVAEA